MYYNQNVKKMKQLLINISSTQYLIYFIINFCHSEKVFHLLQFPKREDLLAIAQSKRNASLPGVNMIPYKVYKMCPKISSSFIKVFQSCFK